MNKIIKIILVILFMLITLPEYSFAQKKLPVKKILMIYSSSPETVGALKFSKGFKDRLGLQSNFEIDYMFEYNELARNINKKDYLDNLTKFLKQKYADNMPDLIVHQLRTYPNPNYSTYFLKYQEIFPNVPVLLTGANEFEGFMKMKLPNNYTGVFSDMDLKPSFDLILQLQPATKKIYLVIGTSKFERRFLAKTLDVMKRYGNKVEFEVLNKQKVGEILSTVRNARKNSVVLLYSFIQDVEKKVYLPNDMISRLTSVASVPVYGTFYNFIENGSIGGFMYNNEVFGKKTADRCIEILNVKKKTYFPFKIISTSYYIFNWKDIKRFGIDEKLLPEESVVINKEYSFWELYYVYIISAIIFMIIEGFLIMLLLINRAHRKRAEDDILKINDQLEIKVLERTNQLEVINEDLRKSKELAEIANKTKGEFLANMSHELRTPLNAVIGFSELLRSLIKDEKYKSYIETINLAGNSLLTLINDILDLSKIESGKLEINYKPMNLNKIFDEIGKIFKQKFESKNLKFIVEIEPEFPKYLLMDEIRIRQILLNLVGNAVKFTDEGHIKLSVTSENYDPGDLSKLNLVISVEDTGIGIPEHEQELIFESFRQKAGQNERKYGGTGLGLSITKKLVEMMNGNIYVKSNPVHGSIFVVELNNINKAALEVFPEEEVLFDFTQYTFEPRHILVVDDVESNRLLLKELLAKVGLNVITAENGYEAVKLTENIKPDLIIMDLMMPVMNGYQATKKIKEDVDTKDIPIIALTASIAENSFSDPNFSGFLTKPVIFEKLLKEISMFIPNKIATVKEDISKADKKIEIDAELMDYFSKNLKPLIAKLEKALTIDKVNKVAEILIEKGKEYNSEAIVLKGEELFKNASSFDIVKIKANLKNILELVLEDSKNGR